MFTFNVTLIHLFALAVLVTGCETSGQSVGLGGAVGAGVGAIAGGLADPGKDGEYRTRNIVLGTAFGGIAGMGAGSMIHESTEKQKKEAFQKGKLAGSKPKPGAMPPLREPRVEANWVESKVVGNRFVEGHFEYQIVEPAHWEEAQ